MYQYRPVLLRSQRQPFHNQISASPFMPQLNQTNRLGGPESWSGLVNPAGLWNSSGLGNLESLGYPGGLGNFGNLGYANWMAPVNQTGFNPLGQLMGLGGPGGLGGLGGPPGWGNYGNPMGWMGLGNNIGQGQPGMLGGLFNLGKGTIGGLGMLSNLINLGKFFY
ncbi:hypothetical protein R4Z10_08935 [Niallia sp. XMNu-256]|uniref:hypothetical protein n=1 Tax=Niallia sp. XMNu-256 TaxID=3082444 RepID=UPI0030D60E60